MPSQLFKSSLFVDQQVEAQYQSPIRPAPSELVRSSPLQAVDAVQGLPGAYPASVNSQGTFDVVDSVTHTASSAGSSRGKGRGRGRGKSRAGGAGIGNGNSGRVMAAARNGKSSTNIPSAWHFQYFDEMHFRARDIFLTLAILGIIAGSFIIAPWRQLSLSDNSRQRESKSVSKGKAAISPLLAPVPAIALEQQQQQQQQDEELALCGPQGCYYCLDGHEGIEVWPPF